MITASYLSHEQRHEDADARASLEQLRCTPGALEHDFWKELYIQARELVRNQPDPADWPDGREVALGAGAWLRQGAGWCDDNRISLYIRWGRIERKLADVAVYDEGPGRYAWLRSERGYAAEVRNFRRLLQRRERALRDAYLAAARRLPESVDGRLHKGYELAEAGAVTLLSESEATVRSASDPAKSYQVNGRCECGDARNGAPVVNGRPACKHQIAVWIERKTAESK